MRRKRAWSLAMASLLPPLALLVTRDGAAQERSNPASEEVATAPTASSTAGAGGVGALPEAPTEQHWYGWQILAADGVATAFMIGGFDRSSSTMFTAGVTVYVLGGPIVHAAHDRWGVAALSLLGLRVALPLTFGIAGAAASTVERSCDFCGVGGLLVGATIGALSAMALDAAFATEKLPIEPRRGTSIALAPWIGKDVKGASLAIGF
jgi:hypothetical protein